MKIEHHFKNDKADLKGLFKDVTKFSTFCSRLGKQAELDIDRYPRDQFVGDGFEFFAELFFCSIIAFIASVLLLEIKE